eukprot:3935039-Rhodomonas_salina.3
MDSGPGSAIHSDDRFRASQRLFAVFPPPCAIQSIFLLQPLWRLVCLCSTWRHESAFDGCCASTATMSALDFEWGQDDGGPSVSEEAVVTGDVSAYSRGILLRAHCAKSGFNLANQVDESPRCGGLRAGKR